MFSQQDVGRLEVAMDDAVRVRITHSIAGLHESGDQRREVPLPLRVGVSAAEKHQDIMEACSRHAGHRVVEASIGKLTDVVNTNDLRMVELTSDSGFPVEV